MSHPSAHHLWVSPRLLRAEGSGRPARCQYCIRLCLTVRRRFFSPPFLFPHHGPCFRSSSRYFPDGGHDHAPSSLGRGQTLTLKLLLAVVIWYVRIGYCRLLTHSAFQPAVYSFLGRTLVEKSTIYWYRAPMNPVSLANEWSGVWVVPWRVPHVESDGDRAACSQLFDSCGRRGHVMGE